MQVKEDVTKLAIAADKSLIILGNSVKYVFWNYIIAWLLVY